MNRKFRSIYLSAIAVVGTGLIGSLFISTADADGWDRQKLVSATKNFIAHHRVHRPAANLQAPPPVK